jgi:signal peptidase I
MLRGESGQKVVTPDTQPEEELSKQAEEDNSHRANIWPAVYEVLETVLLAVVIWLVVNFTTARYVVDGSSMEPTLHTGQFLIVSRLAYRLGSPQRGDVIVFHFPGNPNEDYVKRIIGLPGETVTIQDGRVFINGVPLQETYISPGTLIAYQGSWTVPEGSYFVLGDNRAHSSDSRTWGMLSSEYIIGKAWICYWPPQYWGTVPHYTYSSP